MARLSTNVWTLLMRNHIEPPAPAIAKLKNASQKVLECDDTASLLGLEGSAAHLYFQHFQGMIKIPGNDPYESDATAQHDPAKWTFHFQERNRRPPRDPVKALLSLSYSMLVKDATVAILSAGLDPWVGFYHQIRPGKPSLALDLMEEFRHILADSAVLTAINNGMIQPIHFVRAGNSCNLNEIGRKIFYNAYEQRMGHLVRHPTFDYQVFYRRALEIQARMLGILLAGEVENYPPFCTR